VRVAVGCSYTAGTGILADQTYPVLMGYENWAVPGSDVEYSLWQAHRAVDQGASTIMFQLTSWDRITLSNDARHNFSANRSYTGAPVYQHYTIADYTNTTDPHIKWIFEHHAMSNWRTDNLVQRLLEFKAWAADHKCRVDYLDWLPRNKIALHPGLAQLLTRSSVLDWLGDDYYVDAYYHVNPQGHKRIAGEYFER
jgi:hypothetical protein